MLEKKKKRKTRDISCTFVVTLVFCYLLLVESYCGRVRVDILNVESVHNITYVCTAFQKKFIPLRYRDVVSPICFILSSNSSI